MSEKKENTASGQASKPEQTQQKPTAQAAPTTINNYHQYPATNHSHSGGQWPVVAIVALMLIPVILLATYLYWCGCGSKKGCSGILWRPAATSKKKPAAKKKAAVKKPDQKPTSTPTPAPTVKPECGDCGETKPPQVITDDTVVGRPEPQAQVQQGPTQEEIAAAQQAAYEQEVEDARVQAQAQAKQQKIVIATQIISGIAQTMNGRRGRYQQPSGCGGRCQDNLYELGKRQGYIDPRYPLAGVVGQNQGMIDTLGNAARREQRRYSNRGTGSTYSGQ